MLLLYSAGSVILAAWLYVMHEVYLEAFGPVPVVESRPLDMAMERLAAYKLRKHNQDPRTWEVNRQIANIRNADLHRSLNELVRCSCPKQTIIVMPAMKLSMGLT